MTHVGIETRTSLFGVPHSTTMPSRKHVRVMYTPLNPTFIQQNWGMQHNAGVYLFFLFLLQIIDCGYSLETPRQGDSNVYP